MSVDQPVTVRAQGRTRSGQHDHESGTQVAGQFSPDGVTWATTEPLGYNKTYKISAHSLWGSAVSPLRP